MALAKARGWMRSKKPKLSSIQEKHLVKLFQEEEHTTTESRPPRGAPVDTTLAGSASRVACGGTGGVCCPAIPQQEDGSWSTRWSQRS